MNPHMNSPQRFVQSQKSWGGGVVCLNEQKGNYNWILNESLACKSFFKNSAEVKCLYWNSSFTWNDCDGNPVNVTIQTTIRFLAKFNSCEKAPGFVLMSLKSCENMLTYLLKRWLSPTTTLYKPEASD